MHLYKKEKLITLKKCIVACLVFAAIGLFCLYATGNLSESVEKNEAETLKDAIDNAIVTCYAIEGRYPEDIDYITENYAVVVDDEKFFVVYNIFASNIKPTVTVISYEK